MSQETRATLPPPRAPDRAAPAIEARDLHRAFGERRVLRGLTFAVRPGEVFALLGRNGAGKTTTLRALLGFVTPMAGAARVLGHDARALPDDVRERIGFVGEDHRLEFERTVAATLEFERLTRRRFDLARARSHVDRLGLPVATKVETLSRGQRAQLALVVALAGDPEVLLFDDPAMGLDVAMRRELLDAIIDLLADSGAAVLFTTHVMADVERLADRVGVLHDGRLVADAPRDELRRRVRLRFVRDERLPEDLPEDLPGLLDARRVDGGHALTLLDDGGEALEALGLHPVGDPVTPSLEEVFVTLTRPTAIHREEPAR